jgi:hypothetical protein
VSFELTPGWDRIPPAAAAFLIHFPTNARCGLVELCAC